MENLSDDWWKRMMDFETMCESHKRMDEENRMRRKERDYQQYLTEAEAKAVTEAAGAEREAVAEREAAAEAESAASEAAVEENASPRLNESPQRLNGKPQQKTNVRQAAAEDERAAVLSVMEEELAAAAEQTIVHIRSPMQFKIGIMNESRMLPMVVNHSLYHLIT